MKTYKRFSLPDSLEIKGITLRMNVEISTGMTMNGTHPNKIAKELRKQGRKYAMVHVLSKELRGKSDFHGKPYQPSKWVFTN